MKALLLAAGLGTRLRPITDSVPKCLVPINGVPLLDFWLELLLDGGIERVLVNTHYLADRVARHVENSRWRRHVDLVHETELLGTGGTALENRDYFDGRAFLVAHGDNLTAFDAAAFRARHRDRPHGAEITMMTFMTDRPETCGIVEEDQHGLVRAFHEKVENPPGDRANGAVYIFEPSVLDYMQSLGKPVVDLSTEVLPNFIGRIATFHNDVYLRDIGSPESLARAQRDAARLPALRRLSETLSRAAGVESAGAVEDTPHGAA